MKITLILNDLDETDALAVLQMLKKPAAKIEAIDNPEMGAAVAPPVQGNPFGFGQAPLPPGATLAPSSAVAVPPPTALTVPTPSGIVPPPVPPVPVPPPVPTALAATPPAPPAAAPSAAALGVEVDSAGLPWDARIHAETKTKIKDGTWRQKRGTDPALLAAVEAELRGAVATGAAAAAAPTAVQGPAWLTGNVTSDFAEVMGRAMGLVTKGVLPMNGFADLLKKHGVESPGHLQLAPALIPAVANDLAALGA